MDEMKKYKLEDNRMPSDPGNKAFVAIRIKQTKTPDVEVPVTSACVFDWLDEHAAWPNKAPCADPSAAPQIPTKNSIAVNEG
jgi:hypothetical protein